MRGREGGRERSEGGGREGEGQGGGGGNGKSAGGSDRMDRAAYSANSEDGDALLERAADRALAAQAMFRMLDEDSDGYIAPGQVNLSARA